MPRSTPEHLKLFAGHRLPAPGPEASGIASLPALLRALSALVGQPLRYEPGAPAAAARCWPVPAPPGSEAVAGHLQLGEELATNQGRESDRAAQQVRPVAVALADLLGELLQTRHALWQREAELAAGVPLVPHRDEQAHLALRLQATLRAGGEAVGCQAAALYLLDEATSQLKLRSAWGLPFDRFVQPARALRGSLADLEALLGHAVVLHEPHDHQRWRVPEDFPTAVGLPVSTPTTLLGTLWFYSNHRRDFTARETSVLEVVAGRLASDLEREMLLHEAVEAARLHRQIEAAQQFQRSQRPSTKPQLDGWDIAGATQPAETLSGAFFDWFALPSGQLALTAGAALASDLLGMIGAAAVRAALRGHATHDACPAAILAGVNRTLWTASTGDQLAALAHVALDASQGLVRFSAAGPVTIHHQREGRIRSWTSPSPPVGEQDDASFPARSLRLQPGDRLLATAGPCPGRSRAALPELLRQHPTTPLAEFALVAQRQTEPVPALGPGCALVILHRRA